MKVQYRNFVGEGNYWGITLDGVFYPFGGNTRADIEELAEYYEGDESRFKRMFTGEPVEICPLARKIS